MLSQLNILSGRISSLTSTNIGTPKACTEMQDKTKILNVTTNLHYKFPDTSPMSVRNIIKVMPNYICCSKFSEIFSSP